MSMKNGIKLYLPMYLSVLFSKLIFIPLIGNLIIDAVFILCLSFLLYKRFNCGFFFKSFGFSYLVGFAGVLIAVVVAFLQEFIPIFVRLEELTAEQIHFLNYFFIALGFAIGTALIFCVNFFLNFGVMNKLRPWRKTLKIWQRLLISILLTLLNAPYAILIVRNQWLIEQGYNAFYNVF